jgi:hypothetical protein
MGERYFSWPAILTLGVILAIMPTVFQKILEWKMSFFDNYVDQSRLDAYKARYILWYPFIAAFLIMGFIRSREVPKASVQGLNKSSKYAGDSLIPGLLRSLKIQASPRQIETFYEPAFFFLIGVIFTLVGQSLGTLLIFASIFYRLSYVKAYKDGDNFILDKADAALGAEDVHTELHGELETSPNGRQKFHAEKPKITRRRGDNAEQIPPDNDEPMIAN